VKQSDGVLGGGDGSVLISDKHSVKLGNILGKLVLKSHLALVYKADTEELALSALDDLDEKWGNKYPKIAISWRDNWANLSTYFKYPQEVRTLIYTTNAIEGFNRQLRKVTKNKGVFPTDDSLLKMLYLAMMDITKKWTGKRREWGQIHSQLEIFFADRLS
jgi:transposase-like protein